MKEWGGIWTAPTFGRIDLWGPVLLTPVHQLPPAPCIPPFLTWGNTILKLVPPSNIVIIDNDDDNPPSPSLPHSAPSIDRMTIIGPPPPFLIVGNLLVISVSPREATVPINSFADAVCIISSRHEQDTENGHEPSRVKGIEPGESISTL